jgi:hypothetical protein
MFSKHPHKLLVLEVEDVSTLDRVVMQDDKKANAKADDDIVKDTLTDVID